MACSNCFNGCADIISDQCVKYTGVDIPGLDIHTGDTLLTVENKITSKIVTLMDGSGIIPIIDPADVCAVVQEIMPCCPPINLNQILTVFLKSICILNDKNEGLKSRIVTLETAITALNADYVIKCLTGVTVSSDTHEVLQATIDVVCDVKNQLTQYVKISDINSYIQAYIAGTPATTVYNTRMVPYVAEAYFGPLTGPGPGDGFDANGAGTGVWTRVYICNGSSHPLAPDLRGVALIGATSVVGGGMDPKVDPAIPGNPDYIMNDPIVGNNQAFLTNPNQLPGHTHTATAANAGAHTHSVLNFPTDRDTIDGGSGTDGKIVLFNGTATTSSAGDHTHVITVGTTGSSAGHPNYQPGKATIYIMFIPL